MDKPGNGLKRFPDTDKFSAYFGMGTNNKE